MMNKMDMPWLRFAEGANGGGSNDSANSTSGENEQSDSEKDWKAEAEKWKQFSRTWEDRAKANEDAQKRLAELEDAEKSDLEKATSDREAWEKKAAELEAELEAERVKRVRSDIASEFAISAEDRELFLTASDEDVLRKQAEALAKRRAPENPNQGQGGGSGSTRKAAESWADSLLGKK